MLDVLEARISGDEEALGRLLTDAETVVYDLLVKNRRLSGLGADIAKLEDMEKAYRDKLARTEAAKAKQASIASGEPQRKTFLIPNHGSMELYEEDMESLQNILMCVHEQLARITKKRVEARPNEVQFLEETKDWKYNDLKFNFFVRHGFSLDHNAFEVFEFVVRHQIGGLPDFVVPRGWPVKLQQIATYRKDLPKLMKEYADEECCHEVLRPIAEICAKMDWIDLASYLRDANMFMSTRASPSVAVAIIVSKARFDMMELDIAWRSMSQKEVLEEMMDRTISNMRIGKAKHRPKWQLLEEIPQDIGRTIAPMLDDLKRSVPAKLGAFIRNHVECELPNCWCLFF